MQWDAKLSNWLFNPAKQGLEPKIVIIFDTKIRLEVLRVDYASSEMIWRKRKSHFKIYQSKKFSFCCCIGMNTIQFETIFDNFSTELHS